MEDKPELNDSTSDSSNSRSAGRAGRDYNSVIGNVVAGVVGSGSSDSGYSAGGDMVVNASAPEKTQEFTDMLADLKRLILEAQEAGELNEKTAQKAMTSLTEANAFIHKEGKPPKAQIIRRLQYVADVLDAAVDMISASGGVAEILARALPVAALLIKVAGRVF